MTIISEQLSRILRISRTMLIFRGLIWLALGLCMFLNPGATLWWLTVFIGALVLVDGITMLAAALRDKSGVPGALTCSAVLLILLGIFSIISPLVMNMIWIMLIGIWEILNGIQALFLIKSGRYSTLSILSGLFSIFAGLFFIFVPLGGLFAMIWLIAGVMICAAMSSFILAWKL